jgi:hypothetical protein
MNLYIIINLIAITITITMWPDQRLLFLSCRIGIVPPIDSILYCVARVKVKAKANDSGFGSSEGSLSGLGWELGVFDG